jgi:hypothetical protein
MGPPPVNGTLQLGGANDPRPRGSLLLAGPRELVVSQGIVAAYERDGTVAEDTLRAILESAFRPDQVPNALPPDAVVETCEEEVVWGGQATAPYGHFLTESVSRLWPLVAGGALEGRPVVFAKPPAAPFAREWLDAFGVPIFELPQEGAVRFTRMFVPEPAWRLGAWIAPEIRDIHLQARSGLGLPEPAHGKRGEVLWLSRSELKPDRVAYDEALLEWLLGDRVTAISPETLTLAEQVAAIEGGSAVAGVIGSAFHTLLLASAPPDCLYLCPPWDRPAYAAQHRFLEGTATFVHALDVATKTRRAREGLAFPAAYRILIPEALRALDRTVLPGLLGDPRIAAFAGAAGHRQDDERPDSDAAVAQVLLDPLAIEARTSLGKIFEADGLARCAGEQFAIAAALAEDRGSTQR